MSIIFQSSQLHPPELKISFKEHLTAVSLNAAITFSAVSVFHFRHSHLTLTFFAENATALAVMIKTAARAGAAAGLSFGAKLASKSGAKAGAKAGAMAGVRAGSSSGAKAWTKTNLLHGGPKSSYTSLLSLTIRKHVHFHLHKIQTRHTFKTKLNNIMKTNKAIINKEQRHKHK